MTKMKLINGLVLFFSKKIMRLSLRFMQKVFFAFINKRTWNILKRQLNLFLIFASRFAYRSSEKDELCPCLFDKTHEFHYTLHTLA